MDASEITTEEIQLAYRVCDCLAEDIPFDTVATHLFAATAELLRVALRSRTMHDPLPGQTSLTD